LVDFVATLLFEASPLGN